MHVCLRKQRNQTPQHGCAQTPAPPSCTCACFSGTCFGLVQAEGRFSISLDIAIRRNHLSLWQNASQHSLSKIRSSAASYPVEAWDSVLRRLIAGSAYIADMPFGAAVQVSFHSLVLCRLEACLPVEPESGRDWRLRESRRLIRRQRHSRFLEQARAHWGTPRDGSVSTSVQHYRDIGQHTWIRFFPSGFVTRGCNLGVVKVYTRPVSETTRSRTWVPVRTESS